MRAAHRDNGKWLHIVRWELDAVLEEAPDDHRALVSSDLIEQLLTIPSTVCAPFVADDPMLAALCGRPRYEGLLREHGYKPEA